MNSTNLPVLLKLDRNQ